METDVGSGNFMGKIKTNANLQHIFPELDDKCPKNGSPKFDHVTWVKHNIN